MNLSRLKRVVAILIIIVLFYFIGKSLFKNWHSVNAAKLKFNVAYLILSYIFMYATFLLIAYTWKRSLTIIKEHISFLAALRVNALATLPKYAPGKVWGILGKVYLAKKEGISEHGCVVTISLETILYLLSGIILFLFTASSVAKGRIPYTIYIFLIPICFIIIYPPVLISITNFFLRLFKRPLVDFMPNYIQMLELLLLYTLSWVLQGIGVFFLINSFYHINFKILLTISGLHAFSWVVGFLSIITPGGLGVKEGVFSYFASFLMPAGIAALVALLVRIWGTIGEVGYFAIFLGKMKKYL